MHSHSALTSGDELMSSASDLAFLSASSSVLPTTVITNVAESPSTDVTATFEMSMLLASASCFSSSEVSVALRLTRRTGRG